MGRCGHRPSTHRLPRRPGWSVETCLGLRLARAPSARLGSPRKTTRWWLQVARSQVRPTRRAEAWARPIGTARYGLARVERSLLLRDGRRACGIQGIPGPNFEPRRRPTQKSTRHGDEGSGSTPARARPTREGQPRRARRWATVVSIARASKSPRCAHPRGRGLPARASRDAPARRAP